MIEQPRAPVAGNVAFAMTRLFANDGEIIPSESFLFVLCIDDSLIAKVISSSDGLVHDVHVNNIVWLCNVC